MKNPLRLYNFFFLPWMVWYLPLLPIALTTWLGWVVLAANFVFDSLVLYLAMRRLRLQGRARIWEDSILRVYGIGYASDAAGTMLMIGLQTLLVEVFGLRLHTYWETRIGDTLMALPGILLAGVLIYLLNKRFSFTKCGLEPGEVHTLSLALAVFTAPYLLLTGA